jgi:hypothetical protein
MMEAEFRAIRKALKMLNHYDKAIQDRALKAELALDAIEKELNTPERAESHDKGVTKENYANNQRAS